jgi:HK97 family phage prohead protease
MSTMTYNFERSRARIDSFIEDEEGTFEALASAFGSIATGERGPTRFAPTAFDASVKRQPVVPLLWQHDTSAPIGLAELRVVPHHGLAARCRLALSLQKAREARELVKLGSINGVSLGFNPRPSSIRTTGETHNGQRVRLIGEADVVEVSMVTFPADSAARITWMHRGPRAAEPALPRGPMVSIAHYYSPGAAGRREYDLIKSLQRGRR